MPKTRMLWFAITLHGAAVGGWARTISVTSSGPWQVQVAASAVGDTVSFGAGKYLIQSDTTLPPRTYVGVAGATFSSSGKPELKISGSDVSGLVFDSCPVVLSGANTTLHGNTFTGASTLTLSDTVSDSKIVYNTFTTTANSPVRGYPGDNVTIEYNLADLTKADTSGKDNDQEWLHLLSGSKGLSVSHNVITGGLLRWAIELQRGMQNLKVQGNYVRATVGGSGISCAIGGDGTPPFAHAGENVDISGNVVVADVNPYQSCALEIDGDKSISVHDNYFSGFAWGITNGTGGQAGEGLRTSKNTIIYRTAAYGDGDNTPWPVPPRISIGDKTYKAGDSAAPAPPAQPTKVGAAADAPAAGADNGSSPASSNGATGAASDAATSPPATPPAAAATGGGGLSAVATAHTLTLTWTALAAPATLEIRPTDGDATMGWETAAQLPAGATSALIATYHGAPLNATASLTWKYDVRLTSGASVFTVTAQCLASDSAVATPAQTSATLMQDIAQLAADEAKIAADLAKLQQHQAGSK